MQSIDRQVQASVDGTWVTEVHTFSGFQGYLGEYVNPDNWRDVVWEAVFRANASEAWLRARSLNREDAFAIGLEDVCAEHVEDSRRLESPAGCFDAFYGIDPETRAEWADSDSGVKPVMPATLVIFVSGQEVARRSGIVAAVWEWDEDVRGLHVARFQSGR